MKKHKFFLKFTMLIFSLLILIICTNCKSNSASAKSKELKSQNYNGNLIPFAEYDEKKNIRWGYLDEDTGEIIIKAQYTYASPFVGGYAIVEYIDFEDYQSVKNNKKTIINKAGKIIKTTNAEEAYLLTSESGKSTVAILQKKREKTVIVPFPYWGLVILLGGSVIQTETYYITSVVNLKTGKEIFNDKEGVLQYDIENVGDYFIIQQDLFQFMDNGDIQCVAKNNPALAVSILEDYFSKRGINAKIDERFTIRIDYNQYIKEKYANPDFSGAFNKLDKEFDVPFEKYRNFYRDPKVYLNTPLEITERKYLMYFKNEKTFEYAVGIYNETKDEWEIYPNFIINLHYSEDENISVRKINYNVVGIQQTNNPNLYRLEFKNDEIGWSYGKTAFMGGSIYSIVKEDFIQGLYLFTDSFFRSRNGYGYFEKDRNINFPKYGVYYRDYNRLKE